LIPSIIQLAFKILDVLWTGMLGGIEKVSQDGSSHQNSTNQTNHVPGSGLLNPNSSTP